MLSLATTPGKRFVIPRSSRTTGRSSATDGNPRGRDRSRPLEPNRALLGRRLDLARRDQLLDRVDLLRSARQHVRPEVALIGADADPPPVLLLRRVETAEAAATGRLEHDTGTA